MREKHFYLKESGIRKELVVSYKKIESEGFVELTQNQVEFLKANPSALTEEIEKCELSDAVDARLRAMRRLINRRAIAHPVEDETHLLSWKSRRMNGFLRERLKK